MTTTKPVDDAMPPLIDRLRQAGNDYTIAWGSGDLYDEAADEIERLAGLAAAAGQVEQREPVPSPYLCITPACGKECSGCNQAISADEARANATRYALLQRMDPRFGMPTKWLAFETLNEAMDAELQGRKE